MNRADRKMWLYNAAPVIIMLLITVTLVCATKGHMANAINILSLIQQLVALIAAASGVVFVIAQGSIDLSAGAVLGFSATIATMVANRFGIVWLLPVALSLGLSIGFLTGVLIAKLKISSFLTTLSIGMILRAAMNMLLSADSVIADASVKKLMQPSVVIPTLAVLCVVMFFAFERTQLGYYVRAIGENETACRYAGVPVDRYKIMGYTLSGMMISIAGVLTISRIGGATNSIGTMYELQIMIAIFLGGILVSGGMSAKYYRVLLGAVTATVLENGMEILGVNSAVSQAIRGLILIAIIAITILCESRKNARQGNKALIKL